MHVDLTGAYSSSIRLMNILKKSSILNVATDFQKFCIKFSGGTRVVEVDLLEYILACGGHNAARLIHEWFACALAKMGRFGIN